MPTELDWRDKSLAHFDHKARLDLVHDFYHASKDNQDFLHTRIGLIEDAVNAHKKRIERSMWPDVVVANLPAVDRAKFIEPLNALAITAADLATELKTRWTTC